MHSDDDWVVPVIHSRLPLNALAGAGGKVIRYETTGYGHGIGRDTNAVARALAWERRQRRPDTVRRVRFTATDGMARSAYWAEIVEWGPAAAPATFDARMGTDNNLYLDATNVGVLALDLTRAPVDRSEAMNVVLGTTPITELPPPLAEVVYITWDEGAGRVLGDPPPKPMQRRHFPGGAAALYQGEPLLIVYGTLGDPAMGEALKTAAQAAAMSPSPAWQAEEEGVPMESMLFGRIPVKADTDVTDEDLQTRNLLLLGTARHNALVARMADRFPVRIENEQIHTDDGCSYTLQGRGFGLLYYNPLAPQRLVYWVASEDPALYAPGAELLARQSWDEAFCDFAVMTVGTSTAVAQRNFRSDWSWEAGYSDSPLVPARYNDRTRITRLVAEMLCAETASDFALMSEPAEEEEPVPLFAVGETRWMDLAGEYSGASRLTRFELSGAALQEVLARLAESVRTPWGHVLRLRPAPDSADIDPDGTYRVAVPHPWVLAGYCIAMKETPAQAELLDLTWHEAQRRAYRSLQ
jgi:hypothetical protein